MTYRQRIRAPRPSDPIIAMAPQARFYAAEAAPLVRWGLAVAVTVAALAIVLFALGG